MVNARGMLGTILRTDPIERGRMFPAASDKILQTGIYSRAGISTMTDPFFPQHQNQASYLRLLVGSGTQWYISMQNQKKADMNF